MNLLEYQQMFLKHMYSILNIRITYPQNNTVFSDFLAKEPVTFQCAFQPVSYYLYRYSVCINVDHWFYLAYTSSAIYTGNEKSFND